MCMPKQEQFHVRRSMTKLVHKMTILGTYGPVSSDRVVWSNSMRPDKTQRTIQLFPNFRMRRSSALPIARKANRRYRQRLSIVPMVITSRKFLPAIPAHYPNQPRQFPAPDRRRYYVVRYFPVPHRCRVTRITVAPVHSTAFRCATSQTNHKITFPRKINTIIPNHTRVSGASLKKVAHPTKTALRARVRAQQRRNAFLRHLAPSATQAPLSLPCDMQILMSEACATVRH